MRGYSRVCGVQSAGSRAWPCVTLSPWEGPWTADPSGCRQRPRRKRADRENRMNSVWCLQWKCPGWKFCKHLKRELRPPGVLCGGGEGGRWFSTGWERALGRGWTAVLEAQVGDSRPCTALPLVPWWEVACRVAETLAGQLGTAGCMILGSAQSRAGPILILASVIIE